MAPFLLLYLHLVLWLPVKKLSSCQTKPVMTTCNSTMTTSIASVEQMKDSLPRRMLGLETSRRAQSVLSQRTVQMTRCGSLLTCVHMRNIDIDMADSSLTLSQCRIFLHNFVRPLALSWLCSTLENEEVFHHLLWGDVKQLVSGDLVNTSLWALVSHVPYGGNPKGN